MFIARCSCRLLLASFALAAPSRGEGPLASPLSPGDAIRAFRLADPDLVVELVAAEPDVVSPVAVAWDERGRMFVAEMIDYPTGPPGGRVRMLEGPLGAGRFRRVTVFADSLPFPNGVLPTHGGVLATAAPDVWFLRDADGDGVAEERRIVLTGFAEGNQQLRVNGLNDGLDGWIYGANGRSSGVLRRPEDPADRGVAITAHDFRFRFDGRQVTTLETIAGFSQFGLARDDWGNRFPSWNTTPWRHVVLEDDVLARNPHLLGARGVAEVITAGDVQLFPISRPPTTFNRESVRSFNASCGPLIFRGEGLGDVYRGNAFVCEPLLNLVHRRSLRPEGPTFVAGRADAGREFLASTDPWFHPVFLANGPDGALYVCDFYRRWVEHPAFVPPDRRDAVDWREGYDHGRIWRIARKSTATADAPLLGDADSLVRGLSDLNGWVRDASQRLLVERHGDDPKIADRVRGVIGSGPSEAARVQALWTFAALSERSGGREQLGETVAGLLNSPVARLREQALRVFEAVPALESPLGMIRPLADDPDGLVRFRAAIALQDDAEPASVAARARILHLDPDGEYIRLAVLSGADGSALPMLEILLASDPGWSDDPTESQARVLADLGRIISARDDPAEGERFLDFVSGDERAIAGQVALLAGWTMEAGRRPAAREPSWDGVAALSFDNEAAPHVRALAVETLIRARPDAARTLFPRWLDPSNAIRVQEAAAGGLAELDDPTVAATALGTWGTLATPTRARLLWALGRSARLAAPLLDAIESGAISPRELDPAQRDALGQIRDASIQGRLAAILGVVESDRAAIVARYREALSAPSEPVASGGSAGRELFLKHCAGCHRLGAEGFAVGPDLASIAGRPTDALLDDLLNPSREVSPDYRNYVVFTTDGRVANGLLAADRPGGITLRGPGGVDVEIARDEIEELKLTEKSLMPEGFEQQLTSRDLADLIEFLRRPPTAP